MRIQNKQDLKEYLSQDDIDELVVMMKPISVQEFIEAKEWQRNCSASVEGAVKAFNSDIYILADAKRKGMTTLLQFMIELDKRTREHLGAGDGTNTYQLELMKTGRWDEVELHNICLGYWWKDGE